jgi:peptide/nickel transport system substrate-binding protein
MQVLKRLLVTVLLICMAIFFTACGDLSQSVPQNTADNTRYGVKDDIMDKGPVKGGTLNLFSTKPDTLNPLLTNNAYVRDFLGLMFESLVKIDKSQKPVLCLAASFEYSESGYALTIKLRDNVFWHNNIPISSEDVEYTINTLKRAELKSPYAKNVENILTCEIIDGKTIKLKLLKSNYFTVNSLTFPVIPKHYFLDDNLMNKVSEANMKPVGTGPYRFVSYKENELRMIVNTRWWNSQADGKDALTLPYISEVCVKIYDDVNEAVNAFNRHETDVAFIEPGKNSAYSGRTDMTVKKYISRNFDFLAFNLAKPALSDKIVRKAISYALDKYRLINDSIPGEAISADLPLSPESWLSDARNNAVTPDKNKARELLIQNNWRENKGEFYKYIDNSYTPLTFELLVNDANDERGRTAQRIAEQFKEVGIVINIKKVTWDNELKLINSKNFDMVLIGSTINTVPDLSFLYSTGTDTQLQGNATRNIAGYSNSKVDEMLIGALRTGVPEDQRYFISFAEAIIEDEVPYIGLYFKYESALFSKRIRGEISPYTWNRYDDVTRWYIPQG